MSAGWDLRRKPYWRYLLLEVKVNSNCLLFDEHVNSNDYTLQTDILLLVLVLVL